MPEPVAATIDELNQRFSREEIVAMVRERHPKAELAEHSPFMFFSYTHDETYGKPTCQLTEARVLDDYIFAFCGTRDLPDYFVRCLLPNYRGSG